LMKLATDSITADWGARILSTGSTLYDPMHYNNGAVWPFVTGFVIWGQCNYRRPWSAYPLIDALKQVTFDWARGRHPELLSGRYYRPLDTAVPQQFFATSMLVSPILMGLLGWEPDAPSGAARLAPQLPPDWGHVHVSNLRVGSTTLHVGIQQAHGQLDLTIAREGPPIELTVVGSLPSDVRAVTVATEAGGLRTQRNDSTAGTPREHLVHLTEQLEADTTHVSVRWTGGLAVVPPTVALEPGQRSRGIRVLDFRRTGEASSRAWSLTVEGESGTPYHLHLYGERLERIEGARIVEADDARTTIETELPPSPEDRTTRTILLSAAR